MKGLTKKRSYATKFAKSEILVNSRDRDVVFEAVEEALMPKATLNRTRKTHKK